MFALVLDEGEAVVVPRLALTRSGAEAGRYPTLLTSMFLHDRASLLGVNVMALLAFAEPMFLFFGGARLAATALAGGLAHHAVALVNRGMWLDSAPAALRARMECVVEDDTPM